MVDDAVATRCAKPNKRKKEVNNLYKADQTQYISYFDPSFLCRFTFYKFSRHLIFLIDI